MAAGRKRTVELEFLVNDRDVAKSTQNIEGQLTKTGQAFSSAGKLFAGAFAVDKILDFGAEASRAFSDLNESINAVNVVYGESAEGIKMLGEQAAESVGLANSEFNQLTVGFSAFVDKIAESSGQDVVTVIDDLTTRIADFASVMNLDVNEAAEKFRAGLAGETEPLRQFGIDVSAARVTTEALAMGLGDASGKLSEQEKILGRYKAIMDQTENTAGDFANTSDELANSQRILKARFENTKAILGEALNPIAETTTNVLSGLAEVGGVLFLEFGKLIGAIEDAEGTLRRYEMQTGFAKGTVENLAGAIHFAGLEFQGMGDHGMWAQKNTRLFTEEIQGLIEAADLTEEQLRSLIDRGVAELADKLGITTEQAEILEQLLKGELNATILETWNNAVQAGDGGEHLAAAFGSATVKAEELDEATDNAGEALRIIKERMLSIGDESVTDAWVAAAEAAGIFGEELVRVLERLGLIENKIAAINSFDPNISINTENLGFPETQFPVPDAFVPPLRTEGTEEQIERIR